MKEKNKPVGLEIDEEKFERYKTNVDKIVDFFMEKYEYMLDNSKKQKKEKK